MNPALATTVSASRWVMEATNASTTKSGSGTTTNTSHSSWRRSSPRARR